MSLCVGAGRFLCLSLGIGLGLGACASDPMAKVRTAYAAGQYHSAQQMLLEMRKSDNSNRQLYNLELGVVDQALEEPAEAVKVMRAARNRLDELAGDGTFFSSFKSMFLDDRQLPYTGADYENVLLRAMLAVADLMIGGQDANAYAFQVLEKQQQIIRSFKDPNGKDPKKAYKLVAFGSYLRAIMNEENPLNNSIAVREFQRVVDLAPDFPYGQADLKRAKYGQYSAKGNGVVHIIALVGRGPFRVQVEERATAQVLAIAQLVWNHFQDRPAIPNIVRIPVAALAFYGDNPTEMLVTVDGVRRGVTATVTDVETTAKAEFDAMRDYMMAKAVVRRMFKLIVIEGGKAGLREVTGSSEKRDLLSLLLDLLGILWTASEQADLRCWNLLPADFQVLRVELPEGKHEISLQVSRNGQPSGFAQVVRVYVKDGFNTYVLALAPTLRGGPPPMTSSPADIPKQ